MFAVNRINTMWLIVLKSTVMLWIFMAFTIFKNSELNTEFSLNKLNTIFGSGILTTPDIIIIVPPCIGVVILCSDNSFSPDIMGILHRLSVLYLCQWFSTHGSWHKKGPSKAVDYV
jgi:hypothetical protein